MWGVHALTLRWVVSRLSEGMPAPMLSDSKRDQRQVWGKFLYYSQRVMINRDTGHHTVRTLSPPCQDRSAVLSFGEWRAPADQRA